MCPFWVFISYAIFEKKRDPFLLALCNFGICEQTMNIFACGNVLILYCLTSAIICSLFVLYNPHEKKNKNNLLRHRFKVACGKNIKKFTKT